MYNIYNIYICKYIKHNYYLPRLKIHVWLAISRGSPKNRLGAEAVQGTGLKLRKPKKGECHLASLKRLVGFIGEVFFSGTPCFFSMKFTGNHCFSMLLSKVFGRKPWFFPFFLVHGNTDISCKNDVRYLKQSIELSVKHGDSTMIRTELRPSNIWG